MAKVLLIDDDPDVRLIISKVLRKEGYDVDTAADRDEALARLAETKPAMILLDVLLSGSDGREFCRELKADKKLKDIPVIMLSGHPGAAVNFESYGADDFISKPINTQVLLEKLAQQTAEK